MRNEHVCNVVEGHCLQAMKIVHHFVSGRFDWLIPEHQSVNPLREAMSILSGKYKRFTLVRPLLSGMFVGQRVLCLTGSSLDTNLITFFVLQSPIVADV